MKLGIVGSEGGKFTPETQEQARAEIRRLLDEHKPELVVSGACHLGGIDVWAVEEARARGIPTKEFPPTRRAWSGPGGFMERNLAIAEASDLVVCLTVKTLPPGFKEGGWERYCYHCKTDAHIKSGGCWTMKQAVKRGKQGRLIVVGDGLG